MAVLTKRVRLFTGLILVVGLAPRDVRSQGMITPATVKASLQRIAGPYPVLEIVWFGQDSARIIVEDSSRTAAAVMRRTWMFGPPVTLAEAAGCPPQKVLGRRIARELWHRQGKQIGLQQIIVRVHGSSGLDQLSFEDMYYGRPDLDEPWIGDRTAR